jgi:hypothetical protein
MAIRRMINTRNPDELRLFQSRLTTVGKIRLGVFVSEGRGRPQKIDTFRLTSTDPELIKAAAQFYGGTPREWRPQGGGRAQWEVITEANALPVYVVNGQVIDPTYEAWGAGRTCLRRCDGEWNRQTDEACVCNGPKPPASKDLCKITTRVLLMLQEIPGIGSWMLETHGENAAAELSTPAQLVAAAPMPVPAMLRLRQEKRRNWNAEKGKFESLEFFVPWLDINILTSQQIGLGGDALTRALVAAGAPAAIGSEPARAAIEASPQTPSAATMGASMPSTRTSLPVAPNMPAAAKGSSDPMGFAPPPANTPISDEERVRILTAIENAGIAGLEKIKNAMVKRGIRDRHVMESWASKRKGILARWPGDEDTYVKAVARGATDADILAAGGPTHWLANDDQAGGPAADWQPTEPAAAGPPAEYTVGDTVTVGGIEFTKHSEGPQFDDVMGVDRRPPTNAEAAWQPPGVEGDMFEDRSVDNPDDPVAVEYAAHEAAGAPDVVDAEIIEDSPPQAIEPATTKKDPLAAVLNLGPLGSVDDEYSAVFALAGQPGREWTTMQTNDGIKIFCDVQKVGLATAAQLRALRVKMEQEGPSWQPWV